MEKIVHLERYLMPDDDYLSGRDEGADVRKLENIESIDNEDNSTLVSVISNKLIGINVSWFLGMYAKSIVKCGSREKFLKKFIFQVNKEVEEIIWRDIDYGIKEALDDKNPDNLYK